MDLVFTTMEHDNQQNESTPQTWPDLAIGLYDRLTARNAEIVYELENFDVTIPGKTGDNADRAKWTLNGVMKIRTRNDAK